MLSLVGSGKAINSSVDLTKTAYFIYVKLRFVEPSNFDHFRVKNNVEDEVISCLSRISNADKLEIVGYSFHVITCIYYIF